MGHSCPLPKGPSESEQVPPIVEAFSSHSSQSRSASSVSALAHRGFCSMHESITRMHLQLQGLDYRHDRKMQVAGVAGSLLVWRKPCRWLLEDGLC